MIFYKCFKILFKPLYKVHIKVLSSIVPKQGIRPELAKTCHELDLTSFN